MMAQKASSSASSKKISLKTADGDVFEIVAAIAKQMKTVQDFIDKDENIAIIPLLNIFNMDLSKIIEYCEKCIVGEITKDFEVEYVKDLSDDEVKALVLAAYLLNVKKLYKFLCQFIAGRLENKSVDYVLKYLGIENDFTPEEEAKLCEEFAWAFMGIEED